MYFFLEKTFSQKQFNPFIILRRNITFNYQKKNILKQ